MIVKDSKGVFSDITKMKPVLGKTVTLLKFRDNKCHCTNIMQHIDTHHSIFRHQNLVELSLDSFLGDDFESFGILLHRFVCLRLNLPPISGCETNYSQDSQRIIIKHYVWILVGSSDDVILYVFLTTNQIKNLTG